MSSGEERTATINVRNYAPEARSVSVSVENFFVSPDSEHVNLFGGDAEHPRHVFNVIDWFSIPEDFVLESGEGRDIDFTITIPEEQPTNGYYGTVLFQTTNKIDDDNGGGATQLGVNYRVGAIVTLAVQGDQDPYVSGRVHCFTASDKWYTESPIEITAELFNDGNMHYKAYGDITITRFGKKFATVQLGPEVLYPDAVRIFREKIPFGMWDFGIYSATLTMQSSYQDVSFESTIDDIYVIPREGTMIIIVSLVVLIVLLWFIRNYVTFGRKKK
jgi:hypothetical protein